MYNLGRKVPVAYFIVVGGVDLDYNEWIDKAEKQINTLKSGSTFVLKDLFKGTEWEEIERGDRLGLGRAFKNSVLNNRIKNVEYVDKKKNNSAMYIKK